MTIFDRFFYEPGKARFMSAPGITSESFNRLILEQLSQPMPVFVMDNVIDYIASVPDVPVPKDIPVILPPFPRMFAEASCPVSQPAAPKDAHIFPTPQFIAGWGALFLTVSLRDDDGNLDQAAMTTVTRAAFGEERQKTLDIPMDPFWLTSFWLFAQQRGMQFPRYICAGTYFLTETGAMARYASGHEAFEIRIPHEFAVGKTDVFNMLMGLMVGIGFAHCHNVARDEHSPSRQVRRMAERHGDPAPTTYYTLTIDPMRRVLQAEGDVKRNGLKKALHICRGHFAHYSDDKPMFGKYAGTFWKPAHVRGTLEAGRVQKDYRIKAPKQGA